MNLSGLFTKKKGVIGIDIGSSSIKMVELKETKKGYQLLNYGIVQIPSEVIVDGAIMERAVPIPLTEYPQNPFEMITGK